MLATLYPENAKPRVPSSPSLVVVDAEPHSLPHPFEESVLRLVPHRSLCTAYDPFLKGFVSPEEFGELLAELAGPFQTYWWWVVRH